MATPPPATAAGTRHAARLASLPHEELATYAASLARATPASRASADALLAAHLAACVAEVTLSDDLLPALLAPLFAALPAKSLLAAA